MRLFNRNLILVTLGAGLFFAAVVLRWVGSMAQDGHGSDHLEVSEDGTNLYVSRRYERDLRPFYPSSTNDFAEVTVRAEPTEKETEVVLSPAALETLRSNFGVDFEYQRHNVLAAIKFQIAAANIEGHFPHVAASSFRAEVTRIRVSRNAGQEASGALLTSAGWNAIGAFLNDWEKSQQSNPPDSSGLKIGKE